MNESIASVSSQTSMLSDMMVAVRQIITDVFDEASSVTSHSVLDIILAKLDSVTETSTHDGYIIPDLQVAIRCAVIQPWGPPQVHNVPPPPLHPLHMSVSARS